VLKAREDLLGTTSPSSLVYATLDGWRRHMVEQGEALLGAVLALARDTRAALDALPGVHVMEFESYDPLKIVLDVSGLDISGYQAVDWLREHERVTMGLADHRRMVAHLTIADNEATAATLVRAVGALLKADLPRPRQVDLPSPDDLELATAMLPRDAFFGKTEQVDVDKAVGRVSAEMITPYPPGAPAVLPGEVVTKEVLDYLRSGLAAGMQLPDPTDAELKSVRVVAR
jgi:arginine/lysine/ornithine decarboxylase